jgi:hypothetical protein
VPSVADGICTNCGAALLGESSIVREFWEELALLTLTFVIDAPINIGAALLSVALT